MVFGWHTNSMDMRLRKLGDSEGQGSLTCCSPWGHKESDMTVTEQQQKAVDIPPNLCWTKEY